MTGKTTVVGFHPHSKVADHDRATVTLDGRCAMNCCLAAFSVGGRELMSGFVFTTNLVKEWMPYLLREPGRSVLPFEEHSFPAS